MSKYLAFSDFHIRGRGSRNRLGDYFADCLAKLDEIISIAKKNKCKALIDSGDLYETENPSYNVLDAVADRIEKGKIPVYSLLGNHCLRFGHIENSQSVGLKHLQNRSEFFKNLSVIETKDFEIRGIEYKFGIEEEIKEKGIIFENKEKFNIAVVHAMVTEKPFFKEVSHVVAKDIKTNADLVLCAHQHKSFKVKVGKTTFLNIGCCGRDNIDEANIHPSVLLIDTDAKSWKVIPLKSAKPGEEVFDLTKYAETKGKKKDIKQFLDSLKDVNFQSMDIGQQIVKIGKDQEIEQPVVDYLLKKVGENK